MEDFSYNKSLKELEDILTQIENGDLDLDSLSSKVKRATFLLNECKKNLRETSKLINDVIDDWEEQ